MNERPVFRSESDPVLPGQWRRQLSIAFILSVLAFLVYNANLRLISSGDNYPARYLPFGILRYGTVLLDPVIGFTAQGHPFPYWAAEKYGHTFSKYPIAVPLLITPLYAPAVAYLHWQGWSEGRLEVAARIMEKLTSSLIASVSVGFLYLLLVRRARAPWAIWLSIAYGFGTNTWMISSQALWQHGLGELLVVISLFLLLGRCSASRSFWAGISLGLVACVRPPDAILAAALGLFGLRWAKGRVPSFVIGAAIPLVLLLAYNIHVTHHFAGGYGMSKQPGVFANLRLFRYSLPHGVLGLLFSPARGLFLFSPFLLFVIVCLRYTLREPGRRTLTLLLLLAISTQVLLYARLDWRAGCAWGPRWLTDCLPLLVWMIASGFASLGWVWRSVFVITTGMSISVQAVGAFWYTGVSDAVIMKDKGDPNHLKAVWDIWNTPFIAELRHDPAPRDLLLNVEGCVDHIKTDGHDVDQIVAGTVVEIDGWSLIDHRTPAAVRVTLLPTEGTFSKWLTTGPYPIAQTAAFLERPDVTHTMHGIGPAGWRVVVKTEGLTPGPHRLEVMALAKAGGELRRIVQRTVQVLPTQSSAPEGSVQTRPEDPGIPVRTRSLYSFARDRLRTRQSADGYWLTAHTKSSQFIRPRFEMNIFTTSMIVDILDPVASAVGLEENLERARHHLCGQIETSGLVRYHGRPDSPTIPSLGCVITPDADDTALVWRIGRRQRDARVADVLKVLKSYRSPEGLYRTWLAPRDQFASIDPGQDPNPTDVGIQMNVLMFLAQVDPPKAKDLGRALQSAVGDDRIWVYYKKAPLVPLLREADLHELGYAVSLPQDRLQSSMPGQEIWVEACRQLAGYVAKGERRPSREETHALLESLGKDDFHAVRSNPPLFYHNDLTASVSRFYWSEDFGYALWLRLFVESSNVRLDDVPAGSASGGSH